MSIYSITENNIYNSSTNNYLKYSQLSKFKNFYHFNDNYITKNSIRPSSIKKPPNSRKLFNYNNRINNITTLNSSRFLNSKSKSKSYKDIYNSTHLSKKIKNKFNPDILRTEYISLPKKQKTILKQLDIPKFNTFLAQKLKMNSHLNYFNCINRNNNFIASICCKKPTLNKSIGDIKIRNKFFDNQKKDSMSGLMNLLIQRANKSNKKEAPYMIKIFEKKLIYDKRENLKEYNKFMTTLQSNLIKSKSKLNNTTFFYE